MTNKVLLGLIVALAIGVVVVGSTDKARQQPAAAITAVSKTTGDQLMRTAVTINSQSQDLSVFTALAEAVDLAGILAERGGTYTIFAPNNQAFEVLVGGDERVVLASYSREGLIDLLSYHVVSGRYDFRELRDGVNLTTINGGTLSVAQQDSQVIINGIAMVVSTEETSEGSVVHILNTVLEQERAVTPDDIGPVKGEESSDSVQTVCTDNLDGTSTIQELTRKKVLWLFWGGWSSTEEMVVKKGSCADNGFGSEPHEYIKDRRKCSYDSTKGTISYGLQEYQGLFSGWEWMPSYPRTYPDTGTITQEKANELCRVYMAEDTN